MTPAIQRANCNPDSKEATRDLVCSSPPKSAAAVAVGSLSGRTCSVTTTHRESNY